MKQMKHLMLLVFLTTGVTHVTGGESRRKGCVDPLMSFDAALGVKSSPVAIVLDVVHASPAEQAGLAAGDLIVALNGRGLRDYGDLASFVSALREHAMLSRAVLDVLKYDAVSESYHPSRTEAKVPARAGSRVGFSAGLEVVVTEAPVAARAATGGIRQWDFIEAINGRSVTEFRSILEIDQHVAQSVGPGRNVTVTLRRWRPLSAVEGEGQRMTYSERTLVLLLSPEEGSRE